MKKLSVLIIVSILIMSLVSISIIADKGSGSDSDGGDSSGSESGGDSKKGSKDSDKDRDSKKGSKDSDKDDDDKNDAEKDNSKKGSKDSDGNLITGAAAKDGDSEDKKGASKESDNDDSSDKDKKKETITIIDENGIEVEIKTKTETKDGETKTEEKRTFTDADGNKVEIKTKTEVKNSKTKIVVIEKITNPDGTKITIKTINQDTEGVKQTQVQTRITNPDGTKITIKTKTQVQDGKEQIQNSIKVKGAEVNTKLSIKAQTINDKTTLKAKLSTGGEQDILILPDEALQTAMEELQATNNFTFELKEVAEGSETKAVFFAKATIEGQLFGIFDTQIDLETLIDTETGEIISTKRPWWAFLVLKSNDATICHVQSEGRVITSMVLITDVKSHLAHGDSVGECVATCGDGIIVQGVEACEAEDSQGCVTPEEYSGTSTCNAVCTGFDACETSAFCGDGIKNGPELCDDGNNLDGDGCSSSCQVEIPPSAPVPAPNATTP